MKEKVVKKIELNIPNRVFYSILTLVVISLVSVGVYAYGTTNPPVLGHTMGELHPSCSGLVYSSGTDNSWNCIPTPPSCTGTGKALQMSIGSGGYIWSCADVPSCPSGCEYGCAPAPVECNWEGWITKNPDYCYYENEPDYCVETGYSAYLFHDYYCSDEVYIAERTLYFCPKSENHCLDLCDGLECPTIDD